MRIAWRTITMGSIISRVWADVDAQHDCFAGLRRSAAFVRGQSCWLAGRSQLSRSHGSSRVIKAYRSSYR